MEGSLNRRLFTLISLLVVFASVTSIVKVVLDGPLQMLRCIGGIAHWTANADLPPDWDPWRVRCAYKSAELAGMMHARYINIYHIIPLQV